VMWFRLVVLTGIASVAACRMVCVKTMMAWSCSVVLDDWVQVEGQVQGGSEERPVGMLVILR
jgi:hypothetical protein